MQIVTWNVASLKVRQDLVAMYLDETSPDILCLQELKLPDAEVPRALFEERGYHLAIHGQPTWNGVLIASKHPIDAVLRGLPEDEGEARLVACHTAGMGVVNLYCPQGQAEESPKFAYKLRFYDGLIAWLEATRSPADALVVAGDLNVAPEARDIFDPEAFRNVPSFHPLEHERWRRLCAWGLRDTVAAHVEPGMYSFWDYRAAMFRFNQGMRIDHVLATEPVLRRVTGAWIDRRFRKKQGELKPSDHAPVRVALAE